MLLHYLFLSSFTRTVSCETARLAKHKNAFIIVYRALRDNWDGTVCFLFVWVSKVFSTAKEFEGIR